MNKKFTCWVNNGWIASFQKGWKKSLNIMVLCQFLKKQNLISPMVRPGSGGWLPSYQLIKSCRLLPCRSLNFIKGSNSLRVPSLQYKANFPPKTKRHFSFSNNTIFLSIINKKWNWTKISVIFVIRKIILSLDCSWNIFFICLESTSLILHFYMNSDIYKFEFLYLKIKKNRKLIRQLDMYIHI